MVLEKKSKRVNLESLLNDNLSTHNQLRRVELQGANTRGYNLDEITTADALANLLRTKNEFGDGDSKLCLRNNHTLSVDVIYANTLNQEISNIQNILLGKSKKYTKEVVVNGVKVNKEYYAPMTYESRLKSVHSYITQLRAQNPEKFNKNTLRYLVDTSSKMINAFETYANKQREYRLNSKMVKLEKEHDQRVFESADPSYAKDWLVNQQIKSKHSYEMKKANLSQIKSQIEKIVPNLEIAYKKNFEEQRLARIEREKEQSLQETRKYLSAIYDRAVRPPLFRYQTVEPVVSTVRSLFTRVKDSAIDSLNKLNQKVSPAYSSSLISTLLLYVNNFNNR